MCAPHLRTPVFPQVDFDDGNCPTFYNQIKGIHTVVQAVRSLLPGEYPRPSERAEEHGGSGSEDSQLIFAALLPL